MKKYLFAILVIIIGGIIACQTGTSEPQDLEGKKELLKVKKQSLALLKEEIKVLEKDLLLLDPPKEKPAVLVNTLSIVNQVFERFVDLQGVVVTDDLVYASSETGGRILNTYVQEGSSVNKGQLVAKIDMQTMKNQIAEIETSLSLATTVFERQKRLWDQEIGSEIQYLQAKTNKESLENSLETLKSQLAKQNVYAPIKGIVDKKFLKEGEMAPPGAPIFQIMNTKIITVKADAPETYLGKIKAGDMVEIYFPALNETLKRKITSLGRTIDAANRTFEIEIDIPNNDGRLKPNLLSEVTFMDLKIDDAIVVPVDFVLEEVSGKRYVFVAIKEGETMKAKKRYITLGESYNGNIVITDGLSTDDAIITEGARNIAPNDPIIIANENKDLTNG